MAATRGVTTSLWWDMESCPLPSYVDPYIVASMAPALLRNFNITSMVNGGGGCSSLDHYHFSAYEFLSETQTELHQMVFNCGIGLHQLPPGKNNEMEKMMMADVLLWVMDTPPPANIIFIIGNMDLCYVFQKLRQRSYNVFLVCQSMREMPQGMLSGVDHCLGWLPFLRSLQNEDDQSHFPARISVYDHTFSKPEFPSSSTSIHSREMEESSNASGFNCSLENLFSLKPSLSGGWNSTYDIPPTLSDGWDSTCNFPLDETASSPVQLDPRFHDHFIRTEKPRSPVSSASSTEKTKSASLEEFKAWLTLVVNDKKHVEEGYIISSIRMDFEKATGKILDEKFLGFSKIIDLVKASKDIVVIKKVKRGGLRAFPSRPNEQKTPKASPGGCNPNPIKKIKSKGKPRAEKDPKASAEDLRKYKYYMPGPQGYLMTPLGGGWSSIYDFPPTLSDGWDSTFNFPLDETASSPVQPDPRFHDHFIRTETPRRPVSSASSTEKTKSASLEEFKAWLTLVVNDKKHVEEGYNISSIRMDFEKATGKILDEKFLGFSKIINLVKASKDIVVIKKVRREGLRAFPSRPNEQKTPKASPGGCNPNPIKKIKSKCKPRAEIDPKASAEDLRKYEYYMPGPQGYLMTPLY